MSSKNLSFYEIWVGLGTSKTFCVSASHFVSTVTVVTVLTEVRALAEETIEHRQTEVIEH